MNAFGRRILITVDAVGGIWQYGLDLARGLAARGVEPVIAVLGPPLSDNQHAEAQSLLGTRVIQTGLPLDWLCDGPAPVLAAGEAIAGLARERRADLVHLNMPTLAAARFSVPTVVVAHGCVSTWWEAAHPGEALTEDYRWHRALTRQGLEAAGRLAAPTADYARTISRHYGLCRTVQVVHNGRPPSERPIATPAVDRVLTVGRLWDRVKGADLLDRVAARLHVPFDAAGIAAGPHGERIALRHLNLLGHLDAEALEAQLMSQPIFLSAASFEPFGLAVLEAAGAGCALVLSDIDSFRELWDDAALFVPVGDEDGYVRAVETLLGDAPLRRCMGQAARCRAERYTPQATADAMLEIYAGLLGDRQPGARIAA